MTIAIVLWLIIAIVLAVFVIALYHDDTYIPTYDFMESWPSAKYSCNGRTPHSPFCISTIAFAAALAPVIVVTIGTLFSTAIARIFPSSVCGPFFVGVLMMSCTFPFLM